MSVYLLPSNFFQDEINRGRVGHYYRSVITGYGQVTWQLLGYAPPVPPDTSGIVSLNLVFPNGTVQFMQVSNVDIIGAQYLGPTLPAPGPGPGPGPTPPPRPPYCSFMWWLPECQGHGGGGIGSGMGGGFGGGFGGYPGAGAPRSCGCPCIMPTYYYR
ncbi:hypothetical protein PUW24_09770 [Paenibacillus urinalis]|uniref:Uncharacterized protein n=1 Tax=Paenibacillus urinalis TaxID=521520 RepID=A0ABY7XAL3_9BACL|nr:MULTISPECIES: hypothetical protein [Paenibacillus]WDH99135.1 hypothetical protein PUW24_09770 [Paenibacillus urinalis]WDI02825.1 hypothetical protein PUW25_02215 [Paenibacillus urinalis]GAK40323.1 hypothetical protein TCA2_2813 [Paenibacillus sp. TCA20]